MAIRIITPLYSHPFRDHARAFDSLLCSVWWFRLPREESDPKGVIGAMSRSRAVIMLDRNDYCRPRP